MWGNRVSLRPCPREGLALEQWHGETGFPHAPTRGRAWRQVQMPVSLFEPRPRPREGLALKQG